MNNPLISVIMSVRNSVSTIESSVNCILNQSYGNFEFIIIDDSSEDKTYEILKKYSLKDDRIKLIRNKYQIGLTKSLNIAAKISKGEFIARQDGDDFSFNNRFQKQIEFFKKNKNHVMTGTWFNICIGNLKIEKKFKNDHNYLSKRLYLSNPYCHASTMFKKSIFDKIGGYNEAYLFTQDLDLWFRMANEGKIGIIEELLVNRYINQKPKFNKSWAQVKNSILIRIFNKKIINNFFLALLLSIIGSTYHILITILPDFIVNLLKSILNKFVYLFAPKELDILLVIADLNYIGGTEKHLSILLNGISKTKNIKLFVLRDLSYKLCDQLSIDNNKIISPPKINKLIYSNNFYLGYLKTIIGAIKLFFYVLTSKVQILHFHLPQAIFSGIIICYFFRVKLFASRRSLNNYLNSYKPIFKTLEKILFNRCNTLIGNSNSVIDQLKNDSRNKNIQIIYNGSKSYNLESKNIVREKIRRKLFIKDNEVVFIKVANLIGYKGHIFLLKALSKLKKSNFSWKLILLGRDFGEKKNILKFIYDNEIYKNVIFIENVTEPKDYFFASDINILTSSQEGFSNSIIESMSAGLPNIVSNVGGNNEAVENNYNGFVIKYNDVYGLKKSIHELSINSNLRNKFAENSLKRFNENFTEEICINQYNKVYNI